MDAERVSIVAGSARGIGLGIAQALARRGDRLVLADVLFSDASIRSGVSADVGDEATLLDVDVARADAVAGLIDQTLRCFARVDCLVNAVGINRPAPFYEISEADWDTVIAVNLKGAFLLSKAVAKPMIEAAVRPNCPHRVDRRTYGCLRGWLPTQLRSTGWSDWSAAWPATWPPSASPSTPSARATPIPRCSRPSSDSGRTTKDGRRKMSWKKSPRRRRWDAWAAPATWQPPSSSWPPRKRVILRANR